MRNVICSDCFHCLWTLGLLTCFFKQPPTWNKYKHVVLSLLVGLFPPSLNLLCMVKYDLTLKDPYMVEVPCKDPHHRNKTTSIRVPVILPHELFNWLAENHRFYVSPDAIKQFWKRWSEFKPFHPAAELAVHNPVGISGDDAKYTLGGAKVIIICVNLVLLDRAKRSQANDINTEGCPYTVVFWYSVNESRIWPCFGLNMFLANNIYIYILYVYVYRYTVCIYIYTHNTCFFNMQVS